MIAAPPERWVDPTPPEQYPWPGGRGSIIRQRTYHWERLSQTHALVKDPPQSDLGRYWLWWVG